MHSTYKGKLCIELHIKMNFDFVLVTPTRETINKNDSQLH